MAGMIGRPEVCKGLLISTAEGRGQGDDSVREDACGQPQLSMKVPAANPNYPGFDSLDLHDRRKSTPSNCFLTSTHMLCYVNSHMHGYMHTHIQV